MPKPKDDSEWELTRTTWEIRKAVWDRWRLGDSVERTLDYLDSMRRPRKRVGSKRKGSGIPGDRATINKIRKELSRIPLHMAKKLISEMPDISAFVEKKRPDLKGRLSEEQLSRPSHKPNCIEDLEMKYGHPFVVPEKLRFLVPGYTLGEPIPKDTKPGIPSMQHWRRLSPSEQEMAYDIVRCLLGVDPRDFDWNMQRLAAPGGPGPMRLTWK